MAVIPGQMIIERTTQEPVVQTGLAQTLRIDSGSEAVSRGMNSLSQGFELVAEAQRVTDFSTKKRQYDELTFEAHKQFATTGDKEKRKEIIDTWSKDVDRVLDTDDGVLRRQLSLYKNDVLARDGETFAKTELAIETRNVKDQTTLNIQKFNETGQWQKSNEEVAKLQAMNLISPADAQAMMEEMPNESILAQMTKAITTGNPQLAVTLYDQLSNATEKQLFEGQRLLNAAKKQDKDDSDSVQRTILFDMASKSNVKPADRLALGDKYRADLQKTNISPERAGVLLDRITKFENGQDIKTNPKIKADLTTKILQARSLSKDVTSIKEQIEDNANELSSTDYDKLQKLADSKLGAIRANSLLTAKRVYKKIYGKDDYMEPEFDMAMQAYLDENPTATKGDVYAFANSLLVDWQTKDEEDITDEILGRSKKPDRTPPPEYPDAVWNEKFKSFTVVRNGRLMRVKEVK